MKKFLLIFLILLLTDLLLSECANPGRPTGGPQDTIPPTLIYSNPKSGTVNFKSSEIELEFSEYINADKLKQQLIITPKTDINYKSLVKRNKLYIKLDGELEDSTTYNFNFADGVTDITEKNPVVNLSVAFSTGPFIDSLSIKGSVENLLSKEPSKGFVVGLYPENDSLDYFTTNPMYFTTANDSGNYNIDYIKAGDYKILAFNDDNGNLILDPETEEHGFLEQTINLDSSLSLPVIRTILQNVKPITLINARPAGPYVEIKFNKSPHTYSLLPQTLHHQITGDNKDVIRVYKPESINYKDSIQAIIQVSDSLNNELIDTIKFVFLESNRKPNTFSFSYQNNDIEFTDSSKTIVNFNKPIRSFDSSKFYIRADSIFEKQVTPQWRWNDNKTKLNLLFKWNPDSILNQYQESLPKDTIKSDSSLTINPGKSSLSRNTKQTGLNLEIDPLAFVSIEGDSSVLKSIPLKRPSKKPSGVLKLSLSTLKSHFTVQLVNENGKVAYQKKNEINCTFPSVEPGNYNIRILIDTDKDGKWSYGNLLKNKEPEVVYIYSEETSIRENWIIELGISF